MSHESELKAHHEMFELVITPEPVYQDPEIIVAWRHGLAGTVAVNEYVKALREIGDEL